MDFILIALILTTAAAVVVLLARRITTHEFKCKHCSKTFRIKWLKVIITEHFENEYMLVCPYCQTKDWCAEQPKV